MSNAFLVSLFEGVMRASVLGSIAVVLVLVLRRSLRGRLSPSIRCLLWLPVCALLISPRLPDLGLNTGHETLSSKLLPVAKPEANRTQVVVRVDSPMLLSAGEASVINPASSLSLMECLPLIWAVGSGMLALIWLTSFLMLCRRSVNARQPVPVEVAELFVQCAQTMGLRRVPQVMVTNAVNSPALMGMIRPVMLLPLSLPGALTTEELRMVMLHEAGHVKRHDLLFHWLSLVLLAVHWFNPLCWLAAWLLRADRESACDAAVLKACQQDCRSVYGHTLLKLQAGLVGITRFRPLVGVLGSSDMLRQRIVEIASFGRGSRLAGMLAAFFVSVSAAGIALMAAEPAAPKASAHKADTQSVAAKLETQIFRVPPDILSRQPRAGGRQQGAKDPFEAGPKNDKPTVNPRRTAKEVMQAFGIPFPDGATAVFNPVTSQLIVRNTGDNLKLVQAFVAEASKPRHQVYITSRMVVFNEAAVGKSIRFLPSFDPKAAPVPPDKNPVDGWRQGGVYTDPQMQLFWRALGTKKEIASQVKSVFQLASITTRFGQKAIVEVVRELIYGTEFDAKGKPTAFTTGLPGVRMELEVVHDEVGDVIDLNLSPEVTGLMEWKEFKQDSGAVIRQPVLSHQRMTTGITMHDGSTIAFGGDVPLCRFLLDPQATGSEALKAQIYPVLLFVTARLIDTSGHPAKKNPEAGAAPKAPQVVAMEVALNEMTTRSYTVSKEVFEALGGTKTSDARALMTACDIPLPDGADASYDSRSSKLEVTNTRRNLDLIESLIDSHSKRLGQRVKLTVTTCELTYDKAGKKGADWLTWPASIVQDPSAPKVGVPDGNPLSTGMPDLALPMFALSGVLSHDQYEKVMKAAPNEQGVKVGKPVIQTVTVPDGKAVFDMGGLMKHREVEVSAATGPDGYTIDLTIAAPVASKTGDKARLVSTAVTVWDKQTVVMGGLVSEDGKSKLGVDLFITAEIVPAAPAH